MLGRIRTGTHVRRVHLHRFTRLNAAELVMTPVSRESDRGPKESRVTSAQSRYALPRSAEKDPSP